MNRKLIRTTLAEIKERESHQKDQPDGTGARTGGSSTAATAAPANAGSAEVRASGGGGNAASTSAPATQGRKRQPSAETNAEVFYYKKQIETQTPMIVVLQDGEEVEGVIEWYDRNALKINRKTAPNILLLKHNIKYMYKAEERNGD